MWRDETGRALADYPRPSVAVDVALLTVRAGRLAVLLHRPADGYAAGRWCLPGTFVLEDERLAEAVLRALRDKAGVVGRTPRQLHVFDAPDRDERARVLSVAHVDLLAEQDVRRADDAPGRASRPETALAPVAGDRAEPLGRQRTLPYDHDAIVAAAVTWAREQYRQAPDPAGLLATPFTISDLLRLHTAVAGRPLLKDTFRRTMLPALEPTGEDRSGAVGRPAALYRHRRPTG